jgi:ATP-binding cassette subfamily C (CFTR/MRP) protein 1
VPWKVYFRFFTGAGTSLTVTTFIFILLGQLARVASDWWLGCWSSDSFNLNTDIYIEVYAGASLVVGILIYLKGVIFAKFITNSSQAIQRKLIDVLLHTPLSWFDVTPTGRIISRTTKDQDDLDSNLAFNVQFTVQSLIVTFCSILVIGVATPLYFAFAAVSLFIYYFLIRFYMLTAVELKRL